MAEAGNSQSHNAAEKKRLVWRSPLKYSMGGNGAGVEDAAMIDTTGVGMAAAKIQFTKYS